MFQQTISSKNLAIVLSALAISACGDSEIKVKVDAKPPGTIDAKVAGTPDAKVFDAKPLSMATEVSCAGANPPTVTAPGFAFTPMNTNIAINGIVRFTMPATHSVNSGGQGFDTTFNATKCFKFTIAGTYNFTCNPHGFAGSIVVQ
jgi:plastocyanin